MFVMLLPAVVQENFKVIIYWTRSFGVPEMMHISVSFWVNIFMFLT
jgi:hypothetical protein